jgi:hypothetical protein
MKKKLQHQEQHEAQTESHQEQQSAQTQTAREFTTPEEALRFDAAQTEVPPAIAERLQKSLDRDPPPVPSKSWWRRLFD